MRETSTIVGPNTTSAPKLDAIRDAIQELSEEPLHDWVAVAVWGRAGGEVSVIGQGSNLQMKGYLHSGIWRIASAPDTAEVPAERQSTLSAQDIREFPGGHMSVVRVGGTPIGRGIFEPGWRWSESIAPMIGEPSCPLEHVAFVLRGGMHFVMDDGSEFDVKAGDVVHLAPGHDAWTNGDEPCEMLEILSAAQYGKKL